MARAPDGRAGRAKILYGQGKKLIEIAKELGVSEGTVRSWKSRYGWDCNVANSNATLQKKKREKGKAVVPEMEEIFENPDLTDKQQLFCCIYIRCFNATKAYQKAYGVDYYTAMAAGSRLLGNVRIKNEIQRLKQNRLNREMLSEEDIFQKYMDIAFADITDYVEFGQGEEQVMAIYGPVEVKDPKTGEKKPLMRKVNRVMFKESTGVDGSIISEVKQGRDGASIKLADRMKALQWLADHMDLATEEQRTRIEQMRAQTDRMSLEHTGTADDGVEIINDAPKEASEDI